MVQPLPAPSFFFLFLAASCVSQIPTFQIKHDDWCEAWWIDMRTHTRGYHEQQLCSSPFPRVVFAVLCNVRTISVCLVCLLDQIRWISWSMTQMFISVSCLSYGSGRMLEWAVLSGSPALLKCCGERRLQYVWVCCWSDVGSFNWRKQCACSYTCKWRVLFNLTGVTILASGSLLPPFLDNNPLF